MENAAKTRNWWELLATIRGKSLWQLCQRLKTITVKGVVVWGRRGKRGRGHTLCTYWRRWVCRLLRVIYFCRALFGARAQQCCHPAHCVCCVVLPGFVFCLQSDRNIFASTVCRLYWHSTCHLQLHLHLPCHAHAKFAGRAFDCIFAVCPHATSPPPPLYALLHTTRALIASSTRGVSVEGGGGVASCPCATLLACRLWQLQLPLPLPLARLAHCNIRFRFRCAACPAPFSLSLSLSPPLSHCSSLPLACVCRQLNFDLDCRLPMSQSENCCQLISDDWQPCWQFWQFWSQIRSMSRCLISNANNRLHRKTYIPYRELNHNLSRSSSCQGILHWEYIQEGYLLQFNRKLQQFHFLLFASHLLRNDNLMWT